MTKKQEKRLDRRTFGTLLGVGLGASAVSCVAPASSAAAREDLPATDAPVIVSSVHVIATLGDLKKVAAPHHRQVALVMQYSTRANRGGGIFVFDAESDEKPTVGHVIAADGVKGRWVRMT